MSAKRMRYERKAYKGAKQPSSPAELLWSAAKRYIRLVNKQRKTYAMFHIYTPKKKKKKKKKEEKHVRNSKYNQEI